MIDDELKNDKNANVLVSIEKYIEKLDTLQYYFQDVQEILLEKQKIIEENSDILKFLSLANDVSRLLKQDSSMYKSVYDVNQHEGSDVKYDDLKLIQSWYVDNDVSRDNFELINQDDNDIKNMLEYYSFKVWKGGKITLTFRTGEIANEASEISRSIKRNRDALAELATSSVITLANTFELLISNVFRNDIEYNSKTKDTGFDSMSISFTDLSKIGNVSEARELLVEEHLTDIMKKSAGDWLNRLGKINKKIFKLNDEQLKVVEFFQRRNIIVHNDGIVNNYYLTNVDENLKKNLKKGDKIEISAQYIIKKISELRVIGLKIFWYWYETAFQGEISEIFNTYTGVAFKLLKLGKNTEARNVYELMLEQSNKLNGSQKLTTKINLIQTYKWENNQEKVIDEVKKLDFSLANDAFKMSRCLLLDDFDNALRFLKRHISYQKTLDEKTDIIDEYLTWPLFKKFILEDNFSKYADSIGYEIKVSDIDQGDKKCTEKK